MDSTTVDLAIQDAFGHCQRQVKPRLRQLAAEKETGAQSPVDNPADLNRCPAKRIVDWLGLLTEGYAVVEVLVKEIEIAGLETRINKVGYYDAGHLEQLAQDILEYSGKATAIYFRANPVKDACLGRAANRLKKANKGDTSSAKDIVRRRLMAIDIDPVTEVKGISATNEEKELARKKMVRVRRYLEKRKWPQPVVLDSGNGYHLLFRLDLPVDDDGLIERCLKALHARFSDATADVDTSVHDPARMLKLPGTMACKGDPLPDRPHRQSRVLEIPDNGLCAVRRRLLEQLAAKAPAETVRANLLTGTTPPAVFERARVYLAKIEPGISGQHGSNPTYRAACKLILGFNLTPEEALPLLREYSQRCQPPWTDEELRHKLEDANKELGPRGALRQDQQRTEDPYMFWAPLDGAKFHGYVPDFADADAGQLLAGLDCFRFHSFPLDFLVWRLLRSDVLVPDVWVTQCYWGGRRPRNWRAMLMKRVRVSTLEQRGNSEVCQPGQCLLHGLGVRHQHYPVNPEENWGLLEYFTVEIPPDWKPNDLPFLLDDEYASGRCGEHAEFPFYDETTKKLRDYLRKKGRLIKAYWPALLFGNARHIRWTPSQQRLLQGFVYELTHARHRRNAGRT